MSEVLLESRFAETPALGEINSGKIPVIETVVIGWTPDRTEPEADPLPATSQSTLAGIRADELLKAGIVSFDVYEDRFGNLIPEASRIDRDREIALYDKLIAELGYVASS